MKPIITLLVCIVTSFLSAAKEKKSVSFIAENVTVGVNFSDKSPLQSLQYKLPFKIHSYKIDETRKEIIVVMKEASARMTVNRGHLAVYDMQGDSFKWQKPLNMFDVQYSPTRLLMWNDGGTICFDRSTGDFLWRLNDVRIRHVDTLHEIGLSGMGKGVDLRTGRVIWERRLKGEEYWDNFTSLNDSTYAIISEGLHILDITTGNGFEYRDRTHKRDYTNMIVFGIVGVATAALGGFVIMPVGPDITKGFNSQILVDRNKIYFASMRNLICVDFLADTLVWETRLQENITGKSTLLSVGDSVVLLNYGPVADAQGYKDPHDKAFLAMYNKSEGAPVYMKNIGAHGEVKDLQRYSDTLALIFGRSIVLYDVNHGSEISFRANEQLKGAYNYFLDPSQAYVRNALGDYSTLDEEYDNIGFVITSTDKRFNIFDRENNLIGTRHLDNLIPVVDKDADILTILYGNTISLVKKGRRAADLYSESIGQVVDNKYYFFDGDKFNVVDLAVLEK